MSNTLQRSEFLAHKLPDDIFTIKLILKKKLGPHLYAFDVECVVARADEPSIYDVKYLPTPKERQNLLCVEIKADWWSLADSNR